MKDSLEYYKILNLEDVKRCRKVNRKFYWLANRIDKDIREKFIKFLRDNGKKIRF